MAGQSAQLVKDINATAAGSTPWYTIGGSQVVIDDVSYFVATDVAHGTELWRSDGTTAGTYLAADISPGRSSSAPNNLSVVGGQVYFGAGFPNKGVEPYRFDPATGQATLIRDVQPATEWSSDPTRFISDGTPHGAYFIAEDLGAGLWHTDGTEAGTVPISDASGTPVQQLWLDFRAACVGGILYFARSTAANGDEIWRTDGTSAGTTRVTEINAGAGDASPAQLVAVGDDIFFTATDGTSGVEPFRLDTTTGISSRLADVNAGSASSAPRMFTASGSKVFFLATDADHGEELWAYDRDSKLTGLVKDVFSGTPGGLSQQYFTAPLVDVGGKLFFYGWDNSHGVELWTSDGTSAGTQIVRDVVYGVGSSAPSAHAQQMIAVGNVLYYTATNGYNGVELWRSDGTSAGTQLVQDVRPGAPSSNPAYLRYANGRVLFEADDGVAGVELWSVPVPGQATRVRDINTATSSSSPNTVSRLGDDLFLWANDGAHGNGTVHQ